MKVTGIIVLFCILSIQSIEAKLLVKFKFDGYLNTVYSKSTSDLRFLTPFEVLDKSILVDELNNQTFAIDIGVFNSFVQKNSNSKLVLEDRLQLFNSPSNYLLQLTESNKYFYNFSILDTVANSKFNRLNTYKYKQFFPFYGIGESGKFEYMNSDFGTLDTNLFYPPIGRILENSGKNYYILGDPKKFLFRGKSFPSDTNTLSYFLISTKNDFKVIKPFKKQNLKELNYILDYKVLNDKSILFTTTYIDSAELNNGQKLPFVSYSGIPFKVSDVAFINMDSTGKILKVNAISNQDEEKNGVIHDYYGENLLVSFQGNNRLNLGDTFIPDLYPNIYVYRFLDKNLNFKKLFYYHSSSDNIARQITKYNDTIAFLSLSYNNTKIFLPSGDSLMLDKGKSKSTILVLNTNNFKILNKFSVSSSEENINSQIYKANDDSFLLEVNYFKDVKSKFFQFTETDKVKRKVIYKLGFSESLVNIDPETKIISDIKIYPNPVKNELNFNSNTNLPNTTIYEILSIEGKVVQMGTLVSPINVSHLVNGIYFVKLSIGNQTSTVHKFIKE